MWDIFRFKRRAAVKKAAERMTPPILKVSQLHDNLNFQNVAPSAVKTPVRYSPGDPGETAHLKKQREAKRHTEDQRRMEFGSVDDLVVPLIIMSSISESRESCQELSGNGGSFGGGGASAMYETPISVPDSYSSYSSSSENSCSSDSSSSSSDSGGGGD